MSDNKPPEATTVALLLVLLFAAPGSVLLEGWALSVLWAQNAVPLGAPLLDGWKWVGLVCLVKGFRVAFIGTMTTSPESPEGVVVARALTEAAVLLLLVGISTWTAP